MICRFALALALGGCDLVFELETPADAGADAPPADLVAWYPFDNVDGTVVDEATNRAADGFCAAVDCPTVVPGKIGGAFQFDGTSKLVRAPSVEQLALTEAFTVTVWVHLDKMLSPSPSLAFASAVGKRFRGGTDPNLNSWLLFFNSDNFVVFQSAVPDGGVGMAGFDSLSFQMPQPVGRWTHIAMRWDGALKELFIDGANRAQKPSVAMLFDDGELSFGADILEPSVPDQYFPGAIDDLRVYNRVLSDSELAVLAQP